MSIYGNMNSNSKIDTAVNEGYIKDWLEERSKKRAIKNERSKAVDSCLRIMNKMVQNSIKNGIGIINYSLFKSIDDSAFIKGKSDTWTVYFAPIETNKELEDLTNKISNEVNTRINLYKLIQAVGENETYNYEYYKGLIYEGVKHQLSESKFFKNEIKKYWDAVENFANSDNESLMEKEIASIAKNYGFDFPKINFSLDEYNYYLIISVTMVNGI